VSRTLVVDPGPFTWRFGVVDDDGLAALRVVDLVVGVEGDVFRARVTAHARDLGGLFADIGRAVPVFVRLPAALRRRPPDEGAALLVQGVADAICDKGARATTRLALAGAYLTMRGDGGGPVVGDGVPPPVGARLRDRARRLFAGRAVALAAAADGVDDATLSEEAAALGELTAAVRERFGAATAPGPLLTPDERLGLAARALAAHVDAVVTTETARLRVRRLVRPLGLDDAVVGTAEPWAAVGAPDAITDLDAAETSFGDGAALVIEPTAACVAVDVDRRRSTLTAAALNEAAVAALGRAIAVRELAGQLVVDFLDPAGAAGRERLDGVLRARLADLDVRVVTVLRSGLAVLERPRRAAAWHERRDPPRDAAERLLRQAAGHAIFEATVAADVDDRLHRPALADAARAWLAAHGSRLIQTRDPTLPPSTFQPGNAVS
jgi:Ribonuclease G/E